MKTYYIYTTKGIANLNIYRNVGNGIWQVKIQFGSSNKAVGLGVTANSKAALIRKLNSFEGFFSRRRGIYIAKAEKKMIETIIKCSKIPPDTFNVKKRFASDLKDAA